MFTGIPQKFTAPFGLLGDDAKLAFPTHPNGIAKLASVRNIPHKDIYWEQYFTLFDSASDVFSLIPSHHIRKALLDAPENVATLIRVASTRLFNLISDHTFPSSTNSVTALASSLIKVGNRVSERNTTKEVLNCLRILQRVLPIVFELDGETDSFEEAVLWKKEEASEVENIPDVEEPQQFVIEDEDEDTGVEARSVQSQDTNRPHPTRKLLPSLAERLFNALFDLLFCCGFTLPPTIQIDHHKIQYVIWEKGVGSTIDFGPNTAYDSNKTEVLRLLLVLLSRQIYVAPNSLFSKPSSYTLYLVQKMPRRKILTLLCSLLNTVMNPAAVGDKSFGSMAVRLPYTHFVFKGEDPRTTLIGLCLQILCILLDFQSGGARDRVPEGSGGSPLPAPRTNAFRYFVMKLHRAQDFEFIYQGIVNVLHQQITSATNILPGSRKSVPYAPEIVIFLWKMLELNSRFHHHILESDGAMDITMYLLCYTLDIKDKPYQHGLGRALSYVIQTLSADPAFGTKLSDPLKIQLPAKWHVTGTAADFLINAVFTMVSTASGSLGSYYPALVIALSNSAPYFKNLSIMASSKLVQLLVSFSNPLFLLSDEGHPRLLFFMLEILNSVIYYHPTDNPNLLFGIISSYKIFEDLGTFTLATGLRELKRGQPTQEGQASVAEPQGTTLGSASSSNEKRTHAFGHEATDATVTYALQADMSTAQQLATQEDQQDHVSGFALSSTEVAADNYLTPDTSEKARGKMKEGRSSSLDMNSNSERLARIGRNGFIPTQEWVTSWQERLPLDVVMLVIAELLPKVQELQVSRKANSTPAILDLLSMTDFKHVLPEVPPISPRKFTWSDKSVIWLTSLIWGEVYVRAMTPLGIWNATNVRLFYVRHTQSQQRQIGDAVSQVVGGLLRRNSDMSQTWRT